MLLNNYSTNSSNFFHEFYALGICLINPAPEGMVAYKYKDFFFRESMNKEKNEN